jgi:hypothetical protein
LRRCANSSSDLSDSNWGSRIVPGSGDHSTDTRRQLPETIALSSSRDRQRTRARAHVETALRESIRRNPREIATAIFPVLGPAIRKAIAGR